MEPVKRYLNGNAVITCIQEEVQTPEKQGDS